MQSLKEPQTTEWEVDQISKIGLSINWAKGRALSLEKLTYLRQEVKSNVQSFQRLCGKCRANGKVQEKTVIAPEYSGWQIPPLPLPAGNVTALACSATDSYR